MTLIDKAEALLPCPFCGGEASVWTTHAYSGDSADHVIGCKECDVYMPFATVFQSNKPEPEAIAAWNRRTLAPTDAAEATAGQRLIAAASEAAAIARGDAEPASVYVPDAAQAREATQMADLSLPTLLKQTRDDALLEAWNAVWEAKTLLDAKSALHALIGERP